MKKIWSLKFNDIINIFLVILLLLLSIQKGGFYKGDNLIFLLGVEILGVIVIVYNFAKNKLKYDFDIIAFLLLLFPIAYALPIVFNNYASLNDSIVEMLRYFSIYIIYKLVYYLNNKKIYENVVIYLTLFLGVLGIDGLGARLLKPFLKIFHSNYLDTDLMRMSSTLQYANVLAIIFVIASILLFEKLLDNNCCNDKKRFALNFTFFSFVNSSLILTQSRVPLLLLVIYYIYRIISDKETRKKQLKILLGLLPFLLIYIVVTFKLLYINKNYIYMLTGIFLAICYGLPFIYFNIFKKDNNTLLFVSKNKRKIGIIITILGICYIVLAFLIPAPLKITENSKDVFKRNIYNISSLENNIKFKVNQNIQDSRYWIKIYSIYENNEKELIQSYEYYNNVSGNFDFDFNLKEKAKYIAIEIKCYKGSINVNNLKINDKDITLNYALFPVDIISKIQDVIYGSNSYNLRITYYKDALKIWSSSLKNMLFGVGGEGFNKLYQTVQNVGYTSTEVHSSFLQILVEAGIFGFVIIASVITIYMYIAKKSVYKCATLLLVIHCLVDLDFSYTIILALFAILLAITKKNEKITLNIAILKNFEFVLSLLFSAFSIYLLVKMNIAYYMNIPKVDNTKNDIKTQANLVNKLEQKVMLDRSDNNYRKELSKEYENYLKLLIEWINTDTNNDLVKSEIKNVLENIEKNAKTMYESEKQDKDTLIYVSNIYFNNIYYLVQNGNFEEEKQGYNYYLEKIKNNLEYVKRSYKYNSNIQKKIDSMYEKYYTELESKNIQNDYMEYFRAK